MEKPNRKKVDRQDSGRPINIEQLIEKYGLENLWQYIEKYWNDVESLTTNVSQALTDIDTLETDVQELQPIDSLDSTSTTRPLSANQGKVLDEKTDLRIVTNTEVATNEYIDGNRVYLKRINFGSLPGAGGEKWVTTGLSVSEITLVRFNGIAVGSTSDTTYGLTLPDIYPSDPSISTRLMMRTGSQGVWQVRIHAGADRSYYTAYIDVYYTKNS